MKRLVFLFSTLWIIGSASLVFADSYRGSPYNPYGDQGTTKERGVYEPDKGIRSYDKEPGRWYDSQENYQEAYDQTVKDPKTLTNPYRYVKPYSSEELTNPYEVFIPKRPEKSAPSQKLTPPAEEEE